MPQFNSCQTTQLSGLLRDDKFRKKIQEHSSNADVLVQVDFCSAQNTKIVYTKHVFWAQNIRKMCLRLGLRSRSTGQRSFDRQIVALFQEN